MADVIRRVKPRRWVEKIPDGYTCDTCGCGAEVGSIAAEREGYVDGGVCPAFGCPTPVRLETGRESIHYDPGYTVIRCACGRKLELHDAFLNTCGCGRDYDANGTGLAPRELWGEETGESLADILGPYYDGDEVA